MRELQGLIAAAGAATRAQLPYPKTLFQVRGKPILVRALEAMDDFDVAPTVIVSPSGADAIAASVAGSGRRANFAVQEFPRGMGDAILCLEGSAADPAEHVLLMWGDIPFIQEATLAALVGHHLRSGDDFTFATAVVDSAYTVVERGAEGQVLSVAETRELGVAEPPPGERDLGLFVFRRQVVLELLREDLAGKYGRRTGEHGFLYIIGHMVARGFRVSALPIAMPLDLISFNSMRDMAGYV